MLNMPDTLWLFSLCLFDLSPKLEGSPAIYTDVNSATTTHMWRGMQQLSFCAGPLPPVHFRCSMLLLHPSVAPPACDQRRHRHSVRALATAAAEPTSTSRAARSRQHTTDFVVIGSGIGGDNLHATIHRLLLFSHTALLCRAVVRRLAGTLRFWSDSL